jgi:hypothetical protein
MNHLLHLHVKTTLKNVLEECETGEMGRRKKKKQFMTESNNCTQMTTATSNTAHRTPYLLLDVQNCTDGNNVFRSLSQLLQLPLHTTGTERSSV